MILCFPANIKSNTYDKNVLLHDITYIQQKLLESTTNKKTKIKIDINQKYRLIQFFIQHFPNIYLSELKQNNTHENKLFEKIKKTHSNEITKQIVQQFYNSKFCAQKHKDNKNIFEFIF